MAPYTATVCMVVFQRLVYVKLTCEIRVTCSLQLNVFSIHIFLFSTDICTVGYTAYCVLYSTLICN